ncbi:MAG: alpha/beta fold hydrolase [Acidobacteriota bacterium]
MIHGATRVHRTRFAFCSLLLTFAWIAAWASATAKPVEPQGEQPLEMSLDRAVEVPLDRENPALGRASIHAEFGASFDPAKPVLFVIADAQQFYVRKGAMAELQKRRFGSAFNVVGIIGRGFTPEFIRAAQGPGGEPDWEKAWAVFSADEWVEDIETVRRTIVGAEGKILLYGQSGGAFLVHQYLAKYGQHVARAATPAALNPFLVGELGLNTDRFWEEVGAFDPRLHALLRQALERHAADRARLVMTLQRQNFFVPPDRLPEERASLIRALASGDTEAYGKARQDYQVEAVGAFLNSPEGIPIRVRLFEFLLPSQALARLAGDKLHPDLENQRNFAAPLLDLHDKRRICAPRWDRAALHQLDTEVLVLAGVRDHTVDYRSSVALAYLYPRGHLLLVDDDHQFHRMTSDGTYDALVRSFLASGAGSSEYGAVLDAADRHRWREP